MLVSFPMRATCPAHLILLHLITLTYGEQQKLRSPPLSNFLQSLGTAALSDPNISLAVMFSDTPNYVRPITRETKISTHTKLQVTL
jgi:hypothetical protein